MNLRANETMFFRDLYECFVSRVQGVVSRLSDMKDQLPTPGDVCLVSALESVLPVAAIPPVRPSFNQR